VGDPGAPTAIFVGTPLTGSAPTSVTFTDMSTGIPTSWNWSFGDGLYSIVQHPAHTYSSNGLYTVTLNVSNAFGSDSETKVNYINLSAPITPTPTPTMPIPTSIPIPSQGTGIFNISEKHGETWIQWFWIKPDSEKGSNNTMWVFVDDVLVMNMSLRSNMTISETYLLSGLSGNEQHNLKLQEVFIQ
jgi:PKD repeat protein